MTHGFQVDIYIYMLYPFSWKGRLIRVFATFRRFLGEKKRVQTPGSRSFNPPNFANLGKHRESVRTNGSCELSPKRFGKKFTYMKGENWPDSRGNVCKYPIPWSI